MICKPKTKGRNISKHAFRTIFFVHNNDGRRDVIHLNEGRVREMDWPSAIP